MHRITSKKLDLTKIRLIVTDLDGIWTDGSIYLDDHGREFKKFSVLDGMGINLARKAGIKIAILSSRNCPNVFLRSLQLEIDLVIQGSKDKAKDMQCILNRLGISSAETLYMGDDLPDIPPFKMAGVAVSVPNAPAKVQKEADAVTSSLGGHGAIREVVEWILSESGNLGKILDAYIGSK